MAGQSWRAVRRPRGALTAAAKPALTAASMPITDPAQIFKTGTGGRRDNWQAEAWELFDRVGEFRYYVARRAASCSRVRFVASEVDPLTGQPTGSIAEDNVEGRRFAEIVRLMAGGALGQSQLIRRTVECLSVPGELYTAIIKVKDPRTNVERERWIPLTREEIDRSARGDKVTITLPDQTKHELDFAREGMFRTWNHHPRKASDPDSPVRACLDPLREIVRATRVIAAASKSRLLNGGILFIPQEASLPPTDQAPVSADKPGEQTPAGPVQIPVAQQMQDLIVAVARTAYKDDDAMAGLVPIVAAGPGEHLKNIQHIDIGAEVTDVNIKIRNDAIARLAMGLDISPEHLLGIGSNSNHWSSWLLADEDVQVHVAPVMETICQSIYENVLRNVLISENIDPDKYVLWYDTSGLTADPDKTDEARDAFDRGAITAEALVRYFGLAEDSSYDFATLEGWQQWARDKVSMDPTLLRALLPLLDASIQGLDFPEPQPALPPSESDTGDGGDGQEEPDTEDEADDKKAVTAAVSRRDQEAGVVDLLVNRALEFAGKRRRTREDFARLRDVPIYLTHRYMGPVADHEVSALVKGWDDALDDKTLARMGFSPERVRAEVLRIARRELTTPVIDGQVL